MRGGWSRIGRGTWFRLAFVLIAVVAIGGFAVACGGDDDGDATAESSGTAEAGGTFEPQEGSLTVYSGRSESLVGPLF